ncbi:MAG: T9SS type A sorting domain-containing protein [Bacteroidetes bacterium]|nr:T9SS type A sorting domain-containing protein [Bacteroidota bacterium]
MHIISKTLKYTVVIFAVVVSLIDPQLRAQGIVPGSFEILTMFGIDEGTGQDVSGRTILVSEKHQCIVVVGSTYGQSIPVTKNAVQSEPGGRSDGYIAIFDLDGKVLLYCSYIGAERNDVCSDAALLGEDCVVLVGGTESLGFPVTGDATQKTRSGSDDGWYMVFNLAELQVEYATYFGGNRNDHATRVIVDSDRRIVIAGISNSANLRTSADAWMPFRDGTTENCFIAVIDENVIFRATYLGEVGDYLSGIEDLLETPDSYLVIARTCAPGYPVTPNAWQKEYAGSQDALIIDIDKELGQLQYATYLGGAAADVIYKGTLVGDWVVLHAASTSSNDFPFGEIMLETPGIFFLGLYNPVGKKIEYVTGWHTLGIAGGLIVQDKLYLEFRTTTNTAFGQDLTVSDSVIDLHKAGMIEYDPIENRFHNAVLMIDYPNYCSLGHFQEYRGYVYLLGGLRDQPKMISPSAWQQGLIGGMDLFIGRFRVDSVPSRTSVQSPPTLPGDMYPQPVRAGGLLNIRGGAAVPNRIRIFDTFGRCIFTAGESFTFEGDVIRLLVPNVRPGMYLLEITQAESRQIRKILVTE